MILPLKASYLVTEATLDDVPALIDIHEKSFERGWNESEFESFIQDDQVESLVLRRSGFRMKDQVVGFVLARTVVDESEILTIAVHPDYRKIGGGRELMDAVLRKLYGNRIAKLFLEVDASNVAALSLYKRLGFEKVGERKGYYRTNSGDPSLAWIMQVDVAR